MRPVLLLPVIRHEPIISRIRLILHIEMSRLGKLFGSSSFPFSYSLKHTVECGLFPLPCPVKDRLSHNNFLSLPFNLPPEFLSSILNQLRHSLFAAVSLSFAKCYKMDACQSNLSSCSIASHRFSDSPQRRLRRIFPSRKRNSARKPKFITP